ncbi:hypothetical protein [Oceanibaculum nanhaiense]|uniref:hypothetical protein n=1 Tax=Oceanibaculum nanhaiense TaxID=1909734 RepID=UPI003D29D667
MDDYRKFLDQNYEDDPSFLNPLNYAHLIALGRVSALASALENQIEIGIWILLDLSGHIGPIVTSELSFNGKILLLTSISRARITHESELSDLIQRINNAKKSYEKRNILIHSKWGPSTKYLHVWRDKVKSRGDLKLSSEEISEKEIIEIGDSLRESALSIGKWFNRIEVLNIDFIK